MFNNAALLSLASFSNGYGNGKKNVTWKFTLAQL